MESPPKRMTRARAAAKASEPTVKTTKIITAAARAKSTATAGTKSTAAKRKTRADEHEDDEQEAQREVPAPRRPRGRPKKVDDPAEAEAPAKPTRVRVTKQAATAAPPKDEPAPVKATRGRPRKAAAASTEEQAAEPAKKTTTRVRTTATSRPTAAAKPVVKKSVKFQEPDKENIQPAIEAKEPVRGGLRGRPAKRGAAVGTRTTRAAVRTATTDQKPLSPKKMTQMPVSKDDSEDELAGEPIPVKPLMRNPIKPPTNTINKSQPALSEEQTEPTIDADTVLNPPDLGTSVLASPARRMVSSSLKDTMRSPARRIGPVPLPGSALKPVGSLTGQTGNASPFKASLLQSAAKRPPSPVKSLNFENPLNSQQPQSAMKASLLQSPAKRSFPGMVPLTVPRQRDETTPGTSPAMKPLVSSGLTPANLDRPSAKLMMEDQPGENVNDLDDDPFTEPMESLQFPGRLSAVLPRHADPVLKKDMGIVDEPEIQLDEAPNAVDMVEDAHVDVADVGEPIEELAEPVHDADDEMAVDELAAGEEDAEEPASASSSPSQSPVQAENPVFQLREKDLDPYDSLDSESDDDMELRVKAVPTTPTPFAHKTPKTQGTGRTQAKASRQSLGGFTALAERFGSWSAASPIKMAPLASAEAAEPVSTQSSTPASHHFFEDEMSVRPDLNTEALLESQAAEVEEPSFDDIMVTEEDVALAHEANEMSLLEPEILEGVANTDTFDDTLSEASQEYGDENQFPVDPAIVNSHSAALMTPVRPVMKAFNTTTKVPLKPADDSTPSPLKKRCFTASRVAPKRPTGANRSASVISYSPVKERKSLPGTNVELAPATPGPVTPSKSDLWSSIGTPARTPRRDVDPALLRGAVVFVDVHTSEGADASSIFVELLTQMGAKCMKTWTWSPSGSGEVSSSKVGITHVVFKDGGKRTLEKVRQTNGVVQCVGVSWVLDCERENEWLEEAPFYIDTKVVPRGGARRRKSMEPKALANMNGTLVSSPVKGSRTPSTPITSKNRRESATWMYTPSEQADDDLDEEEDHDWSNLMLTPVPKTPAPDAVARYAANLEPGTPSDDEEDDDLDYSPTKENLLTRTCPPKQNPFREMGAGILSKDKDEQVLMRLMAARRKSLQFAPKIGSPLARAWQ